MTGKKKYIFDKKFILSLLPGLLSIIVIIFSTGRINFNTAIQNILPNNDDMARNITLIEKSPVSDKVVIYIGVEKKDDLYGIVDEFKRLVFGSGIGFTNTVPDADDVSEIIGYIQKNSLLLFPYESKKNPFTPENMKIGLTAKTAYVESIPFLDADEAFFLDPLMNGFEVLKSLNSAGRNKFNSQDAGIAGNDGKSFLMILKSGIFPNDYKKSEMIVGLDKKVNNLSKKIGCTAFVLSSHLYYQESYKSIQIETSIMFFLSTVFTIFIFFYFFRDIKILYYSLLPMLMGISLTFMFIAIFKNNFGGVAFGFGSTILGISSDYTVHYLVKRQTCRNLLETNSRIGKALMLGFVTTIAPLAILPFSGIESLQEIALMGILSVGFSFLFTWFLLRRLAPPGESCTMRSIEFRFFGFKGFIIFLTAFLPFFVSAFFLKFENNISNLDKIHHEMNRRVEIIKKDFGYTADATMLCFSGKTKDEVLSKSLDALHYLENNALPGFLTPALFIPDPQTMEKRISFIKDSFDPELFRKALADSIFKADTFSGWEKNIKNIDSLKLTDTPSYVQREINSMIIEHDKTYYMVIPVQNRTDFSKIETGLKRTGIDFFTIDLMRDSSPGLLSVERIAMIILLISLVLIFIILFIGYKNVIYSLSAMIPAVAGLAGCFGISVMMGRSINIMHIVASMILIGICVDYGVFVTSSYKDFHGKEGINISFLSIFICALVTLSGFGVLMISSNQAMFTLGISVFSGILFSFISSWLVIPYLMKNKVDQKTNYTP